MPDLLACPFCGRTASLENQFGREWWVQCEWDHTNGRYYDSAHEAAQEWNTRAAEPRPAAQDGAQ